MKDQMTWEKLPAQMAEALTEEFDHPEIAHLDDKGLVDFTDFNLYQFLMVSTYEKLVAWASTEWCKEYAKEKGGHLAEMAKHMGWSLK